MGSLLICIPVDRDHRCCRRRGGRILFSLVGAAPVTGLNIYSMIVAVIGAIVVLFIYHAIFGRSGTTV
jgi:hypothetical protein